jgi:tRNA U34 5-methylaminomethyl-2-thiouridine-forming methyltransferase MnmC
LNPDHVQSKSHSSRHSFAYCLRFLPRLLAGQNKGRNEQPGSGNLNLSAAFKLVHLANGEHAVFSADYAETMHPGLGPIAEADLLYVQQLGIPERIRETKQGLVIWDVGLGAGANAITLLRSTRNFPQPLRLVSFDETLEPLSFALDHANALGYLHEYESSVITLLKQRRVEFKDGEHMVDWELHVSNFSSLIAQKDADAIPKPHGIMFDPFSPAKNPVMWALNLLKNLFRLLDASRPCVLTTYSRSTMVRVTLLLAGFFVGRGHSTGLKEETTVAANVPALIDKPLDHVWLQRAKRSTSAEPLMSNDYQQRPLSQTAWDQLQHHPQFKQAGVM